MPDWQLGDVTITRIVEMESGGTPSTALFGAEATEERIKAIHWLQPHFADENGLLKACVQALVIQTPTKRIVVDTCIGNDKPRANTVFANLQTDFLKDMEGAGFPPESIDVVLCTHLHTDHVGWNTMLKDGKWVPTFPNARYLIARTEFEATDQSECESDDGVAYQDSVRPIFEAGLVDLVDTDHQVCPEVSLVPTHGHTPGHVSVRIHSKGQEALITGDFSHHPCQLAQPEWATGYDDDRAAATHTRWRVFGEVADRDVLLIGTHYATPSAGKVVSDNGAFRLVV